MHACCRCAPAGVTDCSSHWQQLGGLVLRPFLARPDPALRAVRVLLNGMVGLWFHTALQHCQGHSCPTVGSLPELRLPPCFHWGRCTPSV
jgi:hypothetical protein